MHKEPRKVREFRRREQEILDTALKLFLDQGEDSVTVEMIADAVGIGKGTIYKHFKSKAEIYLRLMLDYERDLNELLHSADVDRDKEALSRAYFEFRKIGRAHDCTPFTHAQLVCRHLLHKIKNSDTST